MKVAVVGLGKMGSALAVRLASSDSEGAPDEVRVWNRTPGKAGAAEAAGAVSLGTLSEAVAGCDAVVTMLSDDSAVSSLVLDPDSVLSHLPDGAVLIDCSTVSPGLSSSLASTLHRYAAMPVLGSPSAVTDGAATLLLGGTAESVAAARPVASIISSSVVEVGSAPQALAAKVASNFLLLAGLPLLAEAFTIGRAAGLDDEALSTLFASSPLVAPGLKNRFDNVLKGSTEGWFSTQLGGKDVGLAVDLVAGAGGGRPLALAPVVEALYAEAESNGLGGADVASIGRLYRS